MYTPAEYQSIYTSIEYIIYLIQVYIHVRNTSVYTYLLNTMVVNRWTVSPKPQQQSTSPCNKTLVYVTLYHLFNYLLSQLFLSTILFLCASRLMVCRQTDGQARLWIMNQPFIHNQFCMSAKSAHISSWSLGLREPTTYLVNFLSLHFSFPPPSKNTFTLSQHS